MRFRVAFRGLGLPVVNGAGKEQGPTGKEEVHPFCIGELSSAESSAGSLTLFNYKLPQAHSLLALIGICFLDAPQFRENCFCLGFIGGDYSRLCAVGKHRLGRF